MTGARFECLYYTDCRPGQGLRGGAGFQFQAVSPGVSQDAMTLIQRATLYEPPVAWMREQRPVADYPPSLAHVFDGMYVTARGIYLGAEANGVREGNQFTHAVTTADPEAYGQLRPAQLWAASWWVERPAPTTRCDPIAGEPPAGQWGIDAVREWVLGQPDAGDWLTAVHSAFDRVHDPDRRRVLFVADDPAVVLAWVAAGTLLLPQERALRVGFRVFAANPRHSDHDVLAVHPDWAGPLANPDRDDEFVVFNLVDGRHSTVAPTDSALHWVPRFLRAGPDEVYDVVDAIELAQQFVRNRQGGVDVRPSAADRMASGVVLLGERPDQLAGPEVLAEWLVDQPGLAVEDVVEPLVTALLGGRLDVDGWRMLDRVADRHKIGPPLVGRVRLELLRAEIERLPGARPADRPRYEWAPAEHTTAALMVQQAADRISPELMDPLLRLAVDFDIQPDTGGFRAGAARFVRWWADHPVAITEPDKWNCRVELTRALRVELASRCDSRSVPDRLAEDIRAHWWPLLLTHVTDPASPLDAAVASAAVAEGDSRTRTATIDRVAGLVRAPDPTVRVEVAWSALFRYARPSLAEAVTLLRWLPPGGGSAFLSDRILPVLRNALAGQFTSVELDVLDEIAGSGQLPDDRRVRDIHAQDELLRRWLAAVAEGLAPNRATLGKISGQVLAARAPRLLTALLDQLDLRTATGVVERTSEEFVGMLASHLPAAWQEPGASSRRVTSAVALAFLVPATEFCSGVVATQFGRRVSEWAGQASPARIQSVRQLLATVDQEQAQRWSGQVADQRQHGRVREPTRQPAPQPSTKDTEDGAEAKPARFGWLPGRRHKED